jgi:hypothetical protein
MQGVFENAVDLDSHEMMPTHFYPEIFGDVGRQVQGIFDAFMSAKDVPVQNNLFQPEIKVDDVEIDPQTIGRMKGPGAPAATDMRRRAEVLDALNVDTQLVFPGFGFLGLIIKSVREEEFPLYFNQQCPPNHREIGVEAIRAHNKWALTQGHLDGRQRHVLIVNTDTVDEMIADAHLAIDGQGGALWLSSTTPPAGMSPANPALDPFWSLAAANDMPVVLHINTEAFLPLEWLDAPQIRQREKSELVINAYFMTTASFSVENYLAELVIGGVFERHPTLRFGIIECGASWLGPIVERMELLWEHFPNMQKMSRRPMEFVSDQVRVTPFFFEPVDLWLERYPQLSDVYCFSSDYPHSEGGVDAMDKFYKRIAPFGDDALDKFFRSNAELLIPSRA